MTLSGMNSFFGIPHSTSINIKIRYLFGILSVAARKAITKKFLKPDTTSIEFLYDIIYNIFVMERCFRKLNLRRF